jgi:hypothetical protein
MILSMLGARDAAAAGGGGVDGGQGIAASVERAHPREDEQGGHQHEEREGGSTAE